MLILHFALKSIVQLNFFIFLLLPFIYIFHENVFWVALDNDDICKINLIKINNKNDGTILVFTFQTAAVWLSLAQNPFRS